MENGATVFERYSTPLNYDVYTVVYLHLIEGDGLL